MCFVSKINKKNEGLLDKTYEIGVTGGNINPIGDLLRDKHHLYSTGFPKGCLIDFDPIADNVRVRYLNPSNGNVDKEFNLSQKA